MALTGRSDGPPLLAAGRPASAVGKALATLAELGVGALPGVELLGERAAVTGRGRAWPFSVGGAFRICSTRDGWLGLSLARPSDVELLPALLSAPLDGDPWAAVERWAAASTTASAVKRGVRLGLPIAAVPSSVPAPRRSGVLIEPGGARQVVPHPLVVDLTALWAGPLCAHVLGRAGARIVKVESATRPDAARRGCSEFFDLLHGGHESVRLDFEADRRLLQALVTRADVVLEASRPRALRQLGIDASVHVERGAIWVSITAYGRADELRVGFGDDVAAAAGLVAWEDGRPGPAGDALADPLTGITAAAAAVGALREPRGALLDVSMYDVAVASGPADDTGPSVLNGLAAWPPQRRLPTLAAAPLGANTNDIRSEFGGG